MAAGPETPAVGDEVKPYKIHVGDLPARRSWPHQASTVNRH